MTQVYKAAYKEAKEMQRLLKANNMPRLAKHWEMERIKYFGRYIDAKRVDRCKVIQLRVGR